jgi:tRNA(Ile)-lysidine synthase TilS/MesJ
MLNITKTQIREFAKKYSIPHLPNSTPAWSERGRIRDELIPFLNNFDIALVPGFLKLADNMEEVYNIYDKSVVIDFFKKIKFLKDQVTIPLQEDAKEKSYGFIFWKDIIQRIFKKIDYRLPSNKSIKEFVKRVEKNSYGSIDKFKYNNTGLILYL